MMKNYISYLGYLEEEASSIIELALKNSDPGTTGILFSGGKDSCTLLHLVEKVVHNHCLEMPTIVTVDTGHNFEEVEDLLSEIESSHDLHRYYVKHDVEANPGLRHNLNAAQAVTLKRAIGDLGLQMVFGGARRDEDPARAKERVFSHRDQEGNWKPYNQRPEMYGHYSDLRLQPGEHFRVFPLSDWIEADVWEYIAKYDVRIPSLYFSHKRPEYGDFGVRFRTVGDKLVTKPVPSEASNPVEIFHEVLDAHISERGSSRLDDQALSMEARKLQGYF